MTNFFARAHEVRAMLDQDEFVIVRSLKPQPRAGFDMFGVSYGRACFMATTSEEVDVSPIPYAPGDAVVVKETFCIVDDRSEGGTLWVDYRATPRWSAVKPAGWDQSPDDPEALNWRGPQNMRPEHSRLTLSVTDVGVKRLQDVTEEEARLAGFYPEFEIDLATFVRGGAIPKSTHYLGFKHSWRDLHPKTPWDSNPWIVTARCRVHRCNIANVTSEEAA